MRRSRQAAVREAAAVPLPRQSKGEPAAPDGESGAARTRQRKPGAACLLARGGVHLGVHLVDLVGGLDLGQGARLVEGGAGGLGLLAGLVELLAEAQVLGDVVDVALLRARLLDGRVRARGQLGGVLDDVGNAAPAREMEGKRGGRA